MFHNGKICNERISILRSLKKNEEYVYNRAISICDISDSEFLS